MKCCYTLIALFFTTTLFAQVVNTEKMRSGKSEDGWVTEVDITFGLTRNKAGQTINLGSRAQLEYAKANRKWLLFGSYNLKQFKEVDVPDATTRNFVDNSFLHLRHNYTINDWFTWEAFSQIQLDKVQEVRIRLLNGTGPRFRLVEKEKQHLYVGTLYMYEYEETTDLPELTYNRTHRLSNYASVGWKATDALTLNHVSYFQPDVLNWQDYRIASETTLVIQLTDKLSFNAYFQLVYDTRPPTTVPKTMFALQNGLRLRL